VTYAIAKINSDPQLQSTYGARADALTADIIETMDSFDPGFSLINGGRGVYYEPYLDLSSAISDGQTPYNMQDAAGSTYVGLWKATGDQRFYDRAVALANTLKAELTPIRDRYKWRYAPYNAPGSASDISHAGLDVNFVVDAYEAGIVFDDTDIQRLANTMRHMRVGPGFTAAVDGTGAGSVTSTRVAWLWLRLTRYDSALRQQMYPAFRDYWDTATVVEPLFPTLGAALLYETGQPYTRQENFSDSFVGSQMDARWRRPPSQPIDHTWKAQIIDSQLVVSDINTTSSSNQWVDIVRTRDVDQDDSWEVAFDFSWDSTETGADPLQAMQRFSIELRDSAGDVFAEVGISDESNQHSGGRVIELFDQSIIEPLDSLGLVGSAAVKVISDMTRGVSDVYWDNNLLLSIPQVAALRQVAMVFGHYTGLSVASHFGAISVDSLLVNELVLPGDFNGDGTVDAADYVVWRKNDGSPETYGTWRANFGSFNGSSAGAASPAMAAVPEPAAFLCASIGTAFLSGTVLRRRREEIVIVVTL
jgi:hypothetical protein